MKSKRVFVVLALALGLLGVSIGYAPLQPTTANIPLSLPPTHPDGFTADNPAPPATPVKLIFIHHSTGENWLNDDNGGLGLALRDNNYFVSDTNYGWGPDSIGDRTDIPNWPEWFVGPNAITYTAALYTEYGQNSSYSRLGVDPGGENQIVMFKSCFPNSDLSGNPTDPPYSEPNDWELSVGNAKAVYNAIRIYFAAHQEKLFIVIAAPPLMSSATSPEAAANARAFNTWLLNDWLDDYPHNNVAVFDFYNVLTSNGGNANTNDYDQRPIGNHHYWNGSAVTHTQTVDSNYLAYPTSDSHPSAAGNQKATAEFVPLLNVYYNRWKSGAAPTQPTLTLTQPNGGESWPIGGQREIRWTWTGTIAQVSLAYSTDGFATTQPIIASTDNDGSYLWTIPDDASTTARVRVASVVSPTLRDESNANFTIYAPGVMDKFIYLPLVLRNNAPPSASTIRPFPDTTNGIHVFNDQLANMSEEQFQFAATHYAGTQKMTRDDADHLRTYNPNFVILHYRLGLGLGYRGIENGCEPTGDWLAIIEGNDWVQEWPGDANVVEEWFYHWPEASTTHVLNCDWGWYLMNLDNAAWRAYWSGEILRQFQANAADGLFADSFSVPNYLGYDRYNPNLPEIDNTFESQWTTRLNNFMAYMQQGDLAAYHFIPNAGFWVTSRETTNYGLADGVMLEGFGGWGYGNYFDLADWQLQMDRILGLVNQDKIILAQQYINAEDVNDRMFLLGSYLLIKGRYTYLNFDLDLDPEWFPEYSIPIGSPVGGIPANIAALWNAGWGVYTRAYSNGRVLVNPTATTQTVALGQTYYRATPNGGGFVPADGDVSAWTVSYTPVTSVELAPNRGAVLLNAAP
ncbi:MAG TPA: putative glycoside hydrolase [Anaerolineae bacterium]|nr:putative glycoside hydrolase [Anaerolineae bacterium]HQI84184.1 putative glycoside hydrolase [Anaerolineae bacterium]